MPLDRDILAQVDAQLVDRYSTRLQKFGVDPKTLGWDNSANQRARFAVARRLLPENLMSLTDIGCGFADFYSELQPHYPNLRYTGVDINSDLLVEAQRRHPEVRFVRHNIVDSIDPALRAQWVCAFGVMNFRFREFNNYEFAETLIRSAFDLAEEGLVVDMLSERLTPEYPREDFVFYYSPTRMLEFAFELTPHVQLVHDYAAIPQREFILVLRRRAWSAT
jgi:hypothetical protein